MANMRKEALKIVLRNLESARDELKRLRLADAAAAVSAQGDKPQAGWFSKFLSRWRGDHATATESDLGMLLEVQTLIVDCKKKLAVAIAYEYKPKKAEANTEDQE